jgi:menaquinol-cytochrome c reductase iron-sulfur subunit
LSNDDPDRPADAADTPETPEQTPPTKPADATATAEERAHAHLIARRQLLGRMSLALGAAGGVAIGVPVVGFVFAPLFRNAPRQWRRVGGVSDFKLGETVNVVFVDASPLPWAGVTSKTAAWLRRVKDREFIAFSVNCAHLGCPVRWMQDAKLFMCPCHGGVYYEDGSVAAGPPPHALAQYPVRVTETGDVEIHTDPIPIG